jgi:ribosomal protein S18 acetylase RimI-like enzyme
MAATAIRQDLSRDGPRPVSIRTDLEQIADLIEVAFASSMDDAGRAAIREMRMITQVGPLMMLVSGLNRVLGGLEDGFVWVDSGKIIGNVSVSPAAYPASYGRGFIIANVATHPAHRRRGIARQLINKSLEAIRQKGGKFAVLQVDAENHGAQQLYRELGFRDERVFARWHRPAHLRPPARLTPMPFITLRDGREWQHEYDIARLTRPNERGGLAWLRPTHPDLFRPSLLRTLGLWAQGRREERWVMRSPDRRELAGTLRIEAAFGGPDRLELLVAPFAKGQAEAPLINFALRAIDGRYHAVTMEHPLDDTPAVQVLEQYEFERRYSLVHMRLDW